MKCRLVTCVLVAALLTGAAPAGGVEAADDKAGLKLGPWYCDGPFKDKLLTGEPYANNWAVCTEKQANPWIIITLPNETAVSEVEIVNRLKACQEFARTLTVSISTDKKTWTEVWRARRVREQWNVKLSSRPRARYIKLALRETQYLDLKYVFVFSDEKPKTQTKTK